MATTPPRAATTPVTAHKGSGIPHGHVPAYLPGSASLVEELDQRVLIVLRDGKHIIGTLTSYDQFSNLILHEAVERRITTCDNETFYTDVPLGLYVIRGDSMVLCGSVDDDETNMTRLEAGEFSEKQESTLTRLTWDFDTDLTT